MTEKYTGVNKKPLNHPCDILDESVELEVSITMLNGEQSKSNTVISKCLSSHKCNYTPVNCPVIKEINNKLQS